jgi:small-conductance mechanosensitive channel
MLRRKILSNALLLGVLLLLAACIAAFYLTDSPGGYMRRSAKAAVMDEKLLQTAHDLAGLADTEEEQGLAREALRLADHELDLAFASALRAASTAVQPLKGPLKQLAEHVNDLKSSVAAKQAKIDEMAKSQRPEVADQVSLAKAQLALDQDELEEAQQNLARQGGDRHAALEAAIQAHEAAQHDTQLPAVPPAKRPTNLLQQVQMWLSLRDRVNQIEAARQQAVEKGRTLAGQHDALAKELAGSGNPGSADGDRAAQLELIRRLADQRKLQAELDKRIETTQQLTDVYSRWSNVGERRKYRVLHFMFRSLASLLVIVLGVMILGRVVRQVFARQKDPRRLHQYRVIANIVVRFIGVALILLVIFGIPSQVSTVVGLVTAGLTVVMKDFIVAFFGWFTLIGRGGIRIGDWVEINGVSGEVVDIGIFKTVLLEVGNWTSTGHPTGRRVAFSNQFAIEGHYFNFSTTGQWLWDELQVTVPATLDPYEMAAEIRGIVETETGTDARAAEADWERVANQYGARKFSAAPAVELLPAGGGLSIVVRYITRAPQRYEVKARLNQAIVELLRKRTRPAPSPA